MQEWAQVSLPVSLSRYGSCPPLGEGEEGGAEIAAQNCGTASLRLFQ